MNKKYFFTDESWDPNFYNKHSKNIIWNWVSEIFLIWTINTENPKQIRKEIKNLKKEILEDEFLKWIPSIEKKRNNFTFHAKDDVPEVREKMFKLIKKLNIKGSIVLARKKEAIFKNTHNANPEVFYHEIIEHLFKNHLDNNSDNLICFEKRWNKNMQHKIENSIKKAVNDFENENSKKLNISYKVYIQIPTEEECLQVIDYINWATQRAFVKKESRYLEFILDKIDFIWDIYDTENYPNNFYNKDNNFELKKISPIETR